MWFDKYNPKEINDLLVSSQIKKVMKMMIKINKVPNFILKGHEGCGKTTLIKLFLSQIKDTKVYKINIGDMKDISRIKLITKKLGKKVILIDDCNNLDVSVQQTFNILIESSINCSFIFISNNVNNLIDTLKNKCFLIKYQYIDNDKLFNYFKKLIIMEKIIVDDYKLKKIIKYANGNIRTIINNIEINDSIDFSYENYLYEIIKRKDLKKNIKDIVLLFEKGYTLNDIINKLTIIVKDEIKDIEKQMLLIESISSIHIRNNEGLDTLTQIVCLITNITNII